VRSFNSERQSAPPPPYRACSGSVTRTRCLCSYVNRNVLLCGISVYRHPRYSATNCGEQTVALYQGLRVNHCERPLSNPLSLRTIIKISGVGSKIRLDHRKREVYQWTALNLVTREGKRLQYCLGIFMHPEGKCGKTMLVTQRSSVHK
jgi:hypothetical protein